MERSIITTIIFVLALGWTSFTSAAGDLIFIVNAKNPVTSVTINELRDYYFKRRRIWPNGEAVRFIDAGDGTPNLKKFQTDFLNRSEKQVLNYWIGQKLYSGDSAPIHEPSEAMIVQFVASVPGGIGYISDPALIAGRDVKTIKVNGAGK